MTETKDHIPALDGLRGFAALAVVAAHLEEQEILPPPISPHFLGALGVTLFFTLSGFLMAYLYLSKKFTFTNTFNYCVSRFSRIAPLYLFVIIASYLIVRYLDHDFIYSINNSNFLRHLLFSGNVYLFWSIPPEVQFYCFFLFCWWAWDRRSQGKHFPFIGIIVATVVMLYFAKTVPGTTLPSKLHFFLLGAIAGRIRYGLPNFMRPPFLLGTVQATVLATLLFYAYFLISSALLLGHSFRFLDENVYFSPIHSLLCFATVLCFSYSNLVSDKLFANRPMRLLGAWSFSLYLLHAPLLQIASRLVKNGSVNDVFAAILSVMASIALSATAHIFLEKPAQAVIKKYAKDFFAALPNKHSQLSKGMNEKTMH